MPVMQEPCERCKDRDVICDDCWKCYLHCTCECGPSFDNAMFDERDETGMVSKAMERAKEISLR